MNLQLIERRRDKMENGKLGDKHLPPINPEATPRSFSESVAERTMTGAGGLGLWGEGPPTPERNPASQISPSYPQSD